MQFIKTIAMIELVELWANTLQGTVCSFVLAEDVSVSTAHSVFCTFIPHTQPLQSELSTCNCTIVGILCHWYLCIIFYVMGDSFYKTIHFMLSALLPGESQSTCMNSAVSLCPVRNHEHLQNKQMGWKLK